MGAKLGCVDCKQVLAENVSGRLAPPYAKRSEPLRRPEDLERILRDGAGRSAMGLGSHA